MTGVLQGILRNERVAEYRKVVSVKLAMTQHKIWICDGCGHRYFYGVIECPLCESKDIDQSLTDPLYFTFKDVVGKQDMVS